MPKQVSILVNNEELGIKDAVVAGSFDDGDLDILEQFRVDAESLLGSKLVGLGFPGKIDVAFDRAAYQSDFDPAKEAVLHIKDGQMLEIAVPAPALKVEVVLPEPEVWEQFLLRYRPIGLNNERGSFKRTCGVMVRRFNSSVFNEHSKYWKSLFDGKFLQDNTMKLACGDVSLNGDDFFMMWMNAFHYHRDREKQEFVKEKTKTLPDGLSQFALLSLVRDKCKAVYLAKEFVDAVVCAPGRV